MKKMRRNRKRNVEVIVFGVIYCLIFSSYYVTTSFLNIIYPHTAFISFCIFYGLYAVTSLLFSIFSLQFSNLIFKRLIYFYLFLWFGILSFLIFVGFAPYYLFLLLIGSAVCGIGNAFFWLLQGMSTSLFSVSDEQEQGKNKEKEKDISIFYMIYSVNSIIGNLIGLIILLTGISSQNMILYMMIPVFLSFLLSIFLFLFQKHQQNYESKKIQGDNNLKVREEIKQRKGIKEEQIKEKVKNVWKLIASMLYQAAALNITYQIIPRGITLSGNISFNNVTLSGNMEHQISLYNIGTYLVYGAVSVISSFLIGKIYSCNDKKKEGKILVISYTLLEIADLIALFIMIKVANEVNMGWYILVGGIRGYIDMGVNNMLNYELSKYVDKSFYFAFYRFIYSMSYLLFSVCVGYVPTPYVLLSCGILAIFSLISYMFYSSNLSDSSYILENQIKYNEGIEIQFEKSQIYIS